MKRKFGRLLVLGFVPKDQRDRPHLTGQWRHVRCECGTEKQVIWYALKRGGVKSCGCLSRDLAVFRGRQRSRNRLLRLEAACTR